MTEVFGRATQGGHHTPGGDAYNNQVPSIFCICKLAHVKPDKSIKNRKGHSLQQAELCVA